MKLLRHLEDRAALALRIWIIAGILLRVTRLRDRIDGLSLVFYSTPWPVIAAAFVGLAVHFWRRGNAHAVRRYAAFTVIALFTWIALSWMATPVRTETPTIKIIQWNVARPVQRLPACAAWLRQQDADIICLAEFRPGEVMEKDRWLAEFPGYALQETPGLMACLVRGEILRCDRGPMGKDSYFALHRLRIAGRAVNVLQIDVTAHPMRSRREAFAHVVEMARAQTDGNLIIAGDFNTPRESFHLDPLRASFANAFETAGRGLAETWPSFAPALSLDQVWLGRAWRPLSCVPGWTLLSDHRPVVVTAVAVNAESVH